MNNNELYRFYQCKTAERFERLEVTFPGIVALAISIKKIPNNFVENSMQPYSFLKSILTEELREIANLYEKGKVEISHVVGFIKKTDARVKNALENSDNRDKISTMVNDSKFISPKNKEEILKLLLD